MSIRTSSGISRRRFLGTGFSAVAMGLLARQGVAVDALLARSDAKELPFGPTSPLRRISSHPQSVMYDGLPFAPWFTGDDFTDETGYPFHASPPCCPDAVPEPSETAQVVVVGGGISGLATAVMLEELGPIVLELHEQFGGNAVGELWRQQPYSIGSAYVIVPDKGSFLESFYASLGLDRVARYAGPQDPIELLGKISFDFWTGAGRSPEEQKAFHRYADVVRYMAEKSYPEIPLPDGKDNQWILDLDRKTLRQDIEDQMGMQMPPLLAAAVQGYCYSSFGAGMQDLSAAAGWNFLAAEEYGRWVFPGGNAYMSWVMWQRLRQMDDKLSPSSRPYHVRSNCMVVDVRLQGEGVVVTYRDPSGAYRSILSDHVVLACPKHVAKNILHELETLYPEKRQAMEIPTVPYLVANILLDAPVPLDFYDVFLIGDEAFPMDPAMIDLGPRVVDVLSGHYARSGSLPLSVVSLYMPFPYGSSRRASLVIPDPWQRYAEILAPQVRRILDLFGLAENSVRQIRMTRWGHALPVAEPGFIASGTADLLRCPIEDRIFFVNQDNWALPAVENSILDARGVADAVRSQARV